jgi:hypothetical protein
MDHTIQNIAAILTILQTVFWLTILWAFWSKLYDRWKTYKYEETLISCPNCDKDLEEGIVTPLKICDKCKENFWENFWRKRLKLQRRIRYLVTIFRK